MKAAVKGRLFFVFVFARDVDALSKRLTEEFSMTLANGRKSAQPIEALSYFFSMRDGRRLSFRIQWDEGRGPA
jgi:hypothetical protein